MAGEDTSHGDNVVIICFHSFSFFEINLVKQNNISPPSTSQAQTFNDIRISFIVKKYQLPNFKPFHPD